MKTFALSLIVISFAQAAHASCGTFEVSKGDIKVQPASGAVVEASVGAKICSGDTVAAGESARAKIKMEDGNELNISPNSKITIETYQYDVASNKKKVMLNVIRGKIRATTKEENMYNDKAKDGQANTFQIRTKSAVAGVRGTDFLTSFDPGKNKMEVVTFRGKVEVGQLNVSGKITNSVSVAVGQKTEVVAGRAPSIPMALPSGELMKQNTESRNESSSSTSNTPPAGAARGTDKSDKSDDSKREPSSASPSAGPGPNAGAGAGPANGDTAAAPPPPPPPPASGDGRSPSSVMGGPNGGPMGGPSGGSMGVTSGGSMISTGDLPSSNTAVALPKLPLPPPPPPQIPSAILNNNLLINNAIQKRNTTVNLNLHVK